MAARLKAARAPITNAACTCGMCIPSPSVATSTAAVWPRIASQRSRMSVRSRIPAARGAALDQRQVGLVHPPGDSSGAGRLKAN